MDKRKSLPQGYMLTLGGTGFIIESELGRGGNAIVYKASYQDNITPEKSHFALVKELFPLHSGGGIYRRDDGRIICEDEAREFFGLHHISFLKGNAVHLDIAGIRPDMASVNINSYEQNDTVYTILGNSNGVTLEQLKKDNAVKTAEEAAAAIVNITYALDVFHSSGLLHLDISPDNVLMLPLDTGRSERERPVMLIDYNSAWCLEELSGSSGAYYSIKEPYTAPEIRLREAQSVSAASDLFSVCMIFAELLSDEKLTFEHVSSSGKCVISSSSALLKNAPTTAVHKAMAIIKKGLRISPELRYQSTAELRSDLLEFVRRIKGVGVTFSALWESSAAACRRTLKSGAYSFITESGGYTLNSRISGESEPLPALEAIKMLYGQPFPHALITGEGGYGKTTTLLRLWNELTASYRPTQPIPLYIPLYRFSGMANKQDCIKSAILNSLKFDDRICTFGTAAHELNQLLSKPISGGASVLLMLDGFNELTGDASALIREILEFMALPGVQVIITSRTASLKIHDLIHTLSLRPLDNEDIKTYLAVFGLLCPDDPSFFELLNNPMLLNMYAKTRVFERETGEQFDLDTPQKLTRAHLTSLLEGFCLKHGGDDALCLQAGFALKQLLPAFADAMNRHGGSINAQTAYSIAEKYRKLCSKRVFTAAFPEYMGKSARLLYGEWFDTYVTHMLCRQFALLLCSDEYSYRLSHQDYGEALQAIFDENSRKYDIQKRRAAIPLVVMCMLAAAGLCVGGYQLARIISPPPYPHTDEQKAAVKQVLNSLSSALASVSAQVLSEQSLLDTLDAACLSSGDLEKFDSALASIERNGPPVLFSDRASQFALSLIDKHDMPISAELLSELQTEPQRHYEWAQDMTARLIYLIRGKRSDSDKLNGRDAFSNYLKTYSELLLLKTYLLIEPLSDEMFSEVQDDLSNGRLLSRALSDVGVTSNTSGSDIEDAIRARNNLLSEYQPHIEQYLIRPTN